MTDSIKNPSNAPAPAGFRTVIETDENGNEFPVAHGPEVLARGIQISSHWSEPHGIEFVIYNHRSEDGHDFARDELEEVPGMIKSVLETIDLAHTERYLAERPELLDSIKTVTDLARVAYENDLEPTKVFAVYEVRYKAELDAARINRQGGADNA